jgi:hypothetical protein
MMFCCNSSFVSSFVANLMWVMTFDCILHPLSYFYTRWLFVMAQEARVMVAKEEIGVTIGAISGYHQCWCILHRRIGTSICGMQNTRGQLNLAKCLQSLPRYGYVWSPWVCSRKVRNQKMHFKC